MSSVNNIIILGSCTDEFEQAVTESFDPFGKFAEVGESRPNGWRIEGSVFVGAFNYMDSDLFMKCVDTLKTKVDKYAWDNAQVLFMHQHDDKWSLYNLSELKIEHLL